MPKKMRTTRNLLLMATLLGSALFARAADKEMTIGAIYLDTQGYYAGVRRCCSNQGTIPQFGDLIS